MMSPDYTPPALQDVQRYLRHQGWQANRPGVAGTLWTKDGTQIGVPHEPDDELILGIVARLAAFEKRSRRAIADAARYLLYDVAHLRVTNNYEITDTIPLEAAARIITSARVMLRAAGTTAWRQKAHIGRGYSRHGDDVIHDTLMGHTEKGSFVIPVLVPLDVEIQAPDSAGRTLDLDNTGTQRFPAEPFERRVVRTFAQSMQALQQFVVNSQREPTASEVHELVYRGVSRELCLGLAKILSDQVVGEFGARIDWSSALPGPSLTYSSITIDAEAAKAIERVARMLHQPSSSTNEVLTGTIVELRHETRDDPFGEIAISTIRRGKPSEIRVRLPMNEYREAWAWHDEGHAVLVEGRVHRPSPGKPLQVDSPVRCHPVDELYLFSAPD
jgi:hypothetical protein